VRRERLMDWTILKLVAILLVAIAAFGNWL
jgi:hypothetical protein